MAQTVYDPPVATYIPLQTITLGSSASSVTFGSIPQTYRDLVLVVSGTTTGAPGYFSLVFNGVTANYSRVEIVGDGSTAGTFSTANLIPLTFLSTVVGTSILQIMDYSATDKHKTVLYRNNITDNSGAIAGAARWGDTSSITQVALTGFSGGTFVAGTSLSIYGIAG